MAKVLKEYPSVALCLENLYSRIAPAGGWQINFAQVFGPPPARGQACPCESRGAGPLHIEVGTGKATFLLSQAKAQPDVDFLGIERAKKFYRYAVDRVGRSGLTNVRIVRTDAAAFLADFVPDASVDCFHIYFPDPWPKSRHHKRRFLNEVNLQQLLRCLKPAGRLRIATDDGDYFDQIQRLIAAQAERLEVIEFLPAAGAEEGELTGTNYERKYIKDQRQIYTLAVRKADKDHSAICQGA
jgi:tRNA (guanine-N7-)-methyltransferase